MNMKKWYCILIPFSISLTNTYSKVYATPPPAPQHCPSVSAIKTIGVSPLAVQNVDGFWATGRSNQKYDTPHHWSLIMAKIPGNNMNEVHCKATQALDTLSFKIGPVRGPLERWVCYYHTEAGYPIVTAYPSLANRF